MTAGRKDQAARLLRRLRDNPPGRRGQWWERNRSRALEALEAARLAVCAYPLSVRCDCKYGLIPGGHDPMVIGDEHTGCPELRDMIRVLRDGGSGDHGFNAVGVELGAGSGGGVGSAAPAHPR